MLFSLIPHLLGVSFVLCAVQLLCRLRLDLAGKDFATALMALVGGIVALSLAVLIVMVVDYYLPVGNSTSIAAFFVRVAFLIPLAYFSTFITATFVAKVIGSAYSEDAVAHCAFLGITLVVLAPIAHGWLVLLFPSISP